MRQLAGAVARHMLSQRQYAALRGRYRLVRSSWKDAQVESRLFGLAETSGERWSVLHFMVRRIRAAASRADADVTLRIGGVSYELSLLSYEFYPLLELYADRAYGRASGFEPQPGWTVLDIGANAGVVSVAAARRGAYVYACEPNPDCFRRFCNTVAANRLGDRVTALNCAVGASSGFVRMAVEEGHTERGRVERVKEPVYDGSTLVPIRTLDEIASDQGIGRVDQLTVDTEGFEVEVLRGAETVLKQAHHLILEYHADELRATVVDLIQTHGLKVVLDVASIDEVSTSPSYAGRAGLGVLYATR